MQRLPTPMKRAVRAVRRARGVIAMNVGRAASAEPLSAHWGYDRGNPIDRYYIERFIAAHSDDVKGHVLEVQGDDYTRRFGGDRVTHMDILSLDNRNPSATIIGDLADPDTLPPGRFDCIILTQTLHLVFDMAVAIANLHRALRPGGVLLVTVPGITPLDPSDYLDNWYWSLTAPALRRLLSGPFLPEDVAAEAHGNLYAATAFLHAAAVEEVSRRKLDRFDRRYPVTVAARAVA